MLPNAETVLHVNQNWTDDDANPGNLMRKKMDKTLGFLKCDSLN